MEGGWVGGRRDVGDMRELDERGQGLVAEVVGLVGEWEAARARLVAATRCREATLSGAHRKLAVARGGMSQARWDQAMAGGRMIRTATGSRAAFRAARQRPVLEALSAELVLTEVSTRVAVDEAWADLRLVAERLAALRQAAERITGLRRATITRVAAGERPVQLTRLRPKAGRIRRSLDA